jgi:hypothetical protein
MNPGVSISSSDKSNIPESYAIVPHKIEMDQAVLGFRRTMWTGDSDLRPSMASTYRWTTSQSGFRDQLRHNSLYGADPVEA